MSSMKLRMIYQNNGGLLPTLLAACAVLAICVSDLAATAATNQPNRSLGGNPVQFLFIHHSCGGQLLAPTGDDNGTDCIYLSHPNGGGLRDKLEAAGFAVNEASYGSQVGEDTDICHWNRKFREQMDLILATRVQDEKLPDGLRNQIVAFKSCYPNNMFVGRGSEPGDPDSCELTVANAKAAYRALLPYFAQQPDVLFVAVTAPPLADRKPVGLKAKIKSLFKGKPKHPALAREFNDWLADPENGWLVDYDGTNVAVFDYYDVLTGHGQTDWAAYPTQNGQDSHPSAAGNQQAAAEFVPFLQKAWAAFQDAGR